MDLRARIFLFVASRDLLASSLVFLGATWFVPELHRLILAWLCQILNELAVRCYCFDIVYLVAFVDEPN